MLLLERIEGDGAARRLRPSAPLSDAAKETVFFQTDGTPGRIVTGYPTRSRFFPTIPAMPVEAWRHHAGREAVATHSMPDFQLIWLYGPAGTIPTIPIRRVFEAGASGLPTDLSRYTVFVGASDASDRSAYDHFKVPLIMAKSDIVAESNSPRRPFSTLIHRERMFSLPPPAQAGVVFCYALVRTGRLAIPPAAGARSAASWRSRSPMAQRRSLCSCLPACGCRSRYR